MSWSFYSAGRAEKVRETAATGLANCAAGCKSVPAEAAAVTAFAAAVDAVCASAVGQAVKVEGNGSGYTVDGVLRSLNFNAKIEIIDLS